MECETDVDIVVLMLGLCVNVNVCDDDGVKVAVAETVFQVVSVGLMVDEYMRV